MKEHSFSVGSLWIHFTEYSDTMNASKQAMYGRVASTGASSQTILQCFFNCFRNWSNSFSRANYVFQLCVCNSSTDFCKKVLLSVRKKRKENQKAIVLIWLIRSVFTNAMVLYALYKVSRECVQNRLIIEKWNFWFLLTLLQNVIHTFDHNYSQWCSFSCKINAYTQQIERLKWV